MPNAYLYLKAIHIVFVVTWFAGLFYMPRLLIYNVEANNQPPQVRNLLQNQFRIMMKRLWYGITWPSAILTLVFGIVVLIKGGWITILFKEAGLWLSLKLILVVFLYVYQITTHFFFKQQMRGVFKLTSYRLRMWNEIATVFLIAIVMLVVVKQGVSLVWGLAGTVLLVGLLILAIRIHKRLRRSP